LSVRWTPTALHDLDEIWFTVATESVAAADRLVDDIIATADHLSLFPRIGRPRDDLGHPAVRSLPVKNYLVFYRVQRENGVEILRVRHGARSELL
jgi:plasmid stabilization system protein ParE